MSYVIQAASECETAVIVSAAHAESMTIAVEPEQWHDDEVELACGKQFVRVGLWFWNTETVISQRIAWSPATEPQLPGTKRMQNGQVAFLS